MNPSFSPILVLFFTLTSHPLSLSPPILIVSSIVTVNNHYLLSQNINNKNTMKKDNAKTGKQKNVSGQTLPVIDNNAFNQTIIINNPKININYIEQANNIKAANASGVHFRKQNTSKGFNQYAKNQQPGEDSSKGFDAWNFNNNLKEFSETRQLGFYKGNSKTKNQKVQPSPYLVHKTKTQDLKPINKITPNPQKAYEPSSFREQNRTISTTRREAIQLLQQQKQRDRSQPHTINPSNKAYMNQNRKNRSKNSEIIDKPTKTKKQMLSQKTITPLEHSILKRDITKRVNHARNQHGSTLTTIVINQTSRLKLRNVDDNKFFTKKSENDEYDDNYQEYEDFLNNAKNQINLRKGVNEVENQEEYDRDFDEEIENLEQDALLINESPLLQRSPTKKPKTQDHQNISKTQALIQRKSHGQNPRSYQRSIDKISNCFLKQVDNYFDHVDTHQIPSSKIQLYASTLSQPHILPKQAGQKQITIDKVYQGYDFQFQQQKPKKRPRTPYKRKKMYEQIN